MNRKLTIAIILIIITILSMIFPSFSIFFLTILLAILLAILLFAVIFSVWMIRKKEVNKEIKQIIVIQQNRQTLASFVIGCIGAAIGGFYDYLMLTMEGRDIEPIMPAYFVFIAGLTSGFLSCFYCSKIFFKLIQDKSWRYGICLATAFGVIAGAISGFLIGFSWSPIPGALFGIIFGSIIGLVVGLVYWLIFGKLVFRFLIKAQNSSV